MWSCKLQAARLTCRSPISGSSDAAPPNREAANETQPLCLDETPHGCTGDGGDGGQGGASGSDAGHRGGAGVRGRGGSDVFKRAPACVAPLSRAPTGGGGGLCGPPCPCMPLSACQ
eukprot:scaffold2723_cov108-Isochrysis_galbana.AAC.21